MKTSKIIFISLLGTIALIILLSGFDIRINGAKKGELLSDNDFKVKKQPVPSYKVLCLKDSKSISITQGDSSFIIVGYKKDAPAPEVKYTMKEDTLFVTDLKFSGITLCATSSLNIISMNNSDVTFRGSTWDSSSGKLTLVMDQSTAMLFQNKTSIANLNIDARNHSSINASNFSVDLLEIVLQNSKSTFSNSIKRVTGSLSESSSLMVRQPLEIALKRDAGSKITVYGN